MSRVKGTDEEPMPYEDEAVFWQARVMSGGMSEEEKLLLESWLAASEQNKTAFMKLKDSLVALDDCGDDLLASEFEDELNERADESNFSYRQFFGIAATFMIVCVSVAAIILFDVLPSQSKIYATEIGERNQFTLNDGSQIELNTNSVAEVRYSRNIRAVSLSGGQAFFAVERDPERPFVVSTEHAEIVVTGTVFDVNTFGDKSTINVISGAVTVKPKTGRHVTLLAGDSLLISDETGVSPVQHFDPYAVLSWRSGKLVFDDVPLKEVVSDLNRYFTKPIVVEEASLEHLSVTGEFNIEEEDAAVLALSLIFSLEVKSEPNRILLWRGSE